jgi:hypothetical protein
MTPRITELEDKSERAELYRISLRRWWWIDLGLKMAAGALAALLAYLVFYSLVAAWAWYFGGTAPKPADAAPAPSLEQREPAVQLRPALEAGDVRVGAEGLSFGW